MIHYDTSVFWRNIFKLDGSVFPKALQVALPCGLATAALRWGMNKDLVNALEIDPTAWSGFNFALGFLIVFRTSQGYARFWDGCTFIHQMRAEWFDAASSACAFCKHSQADPEAILVFKNILVRLFSMLHAAALGEVEAADGDSSTAAFDFELLDPQGLDDESLATLKSSDSKVELLFTWIMQLVVEQIETGVQSIPAPILSRFFQEAANGMVAFHEACKIAHIPFPFPYAQTCDLLLILHWLAVPVVVAQWVPDPAFAGFIAALPVFTMWSLNLIAVEIEGPFGRDKNDIDGSAIQVIMNRDLTMLMRETTSRTPSLSETAIPIGKSVKNKSGRALGSMSLNDAWKPIVCCVEEECIIIDEEVPTALGVRGAQEREERARRQSTYLTESSHSSRTDASDSQKSGKRTRCHAKDDHLSVCRNQPSTSDGPGNCFPNNLSPTSRSSLSESQDSHYSTEVKLTVCHV